MRLFIIGNGFDKAHGLPTGYMDFRDYLEKEDYEYLAALESPYGYVPESKRDHVEKYLWKEFENNLSDINEDEIVDMANSIDMGLEGGDVDIEDTLNVYWEDRYGYIQKLNDYILQWVKQIDSNVCKKTTKIDTDNDDYFLSFNYTLLLEQVYDIDSSDVLHIHGSIEQRDMEPVIGHGNSQKIYEAKVKAETASENYWEKDSSIYKALSNYYERTMKDVQSFLSLNSYFFQRLAKVDCIYILGHSLGDVDMPYFKKIEDSVCRDAKWKVCYFDKDEEQTLKNKLIEIGLKYENIQMISTKEFYDLNLKL